jgi:DNA polymerase III subunit delta'
MSAAFRRLQDVRGQEGVVALLRRLVARDRLPHAIVFEGVPGCGRRTITTALTAALLCQQRDEGDACGTCASCRMVAEGNHPDAVGLPHDTEEDHPDADIAEAARAQLNAEAVRDLIEVRAWESPLLGKRRVFVLPSVERLQRGQATMANALLKALEEPPPSVHFLLTTASVGGLMATIRSRAQCYRLLGLSSDDVEQVLIAGGVPRGDAARRAAISGGSHRGLWASDMEAVPIAEIRSLIDDGLQLHALASLVTQLPGRESGAGEARRTLRRWLLAVQQDYRKELRGPGGNGAAEAIERIGRSLRDLGLNLQPRLVLEGLSLGSG